MKTIPHINAERLGFTEADLNIAKATAMLTIGLNTEKTLPELKIIAPPGVTEADAIALLQGAADGLRNKNIKLN